MTEFLFARLGELQSGTNVPGTLNFTLIAQPANPAAGTYNIYADTTNLVLTGVDATGRKTITVVPNAGVANQFVTGLAANGALTLAQPAFANLSGIAQANQGGTGLATLTANAVLLGAGTGAIQFATIGTAGRLLIDQGAAANPAFTAMSGDATITGAGALTVANSAITNAKQANMAAWTLKMNNSGGAVAPQDVTIDGLTLKASPVGADEVALWDVAGASMKKATLTAVIGASGVTSYNGQIGAITVLNPPGGRLTLSTGTPVMTTSVAAAATVFFTPYLTSFILIYNGTNFVPTVFAELSQATTDTTKSPAAVAANSVYDLFVWNDAGTIRCTRGPAWTNDTTRSAGTALVAVNGILLNNASITNGPAAQRGTYVGTVRSNGSSTIDWIFGSAASGGGAASLHVWNMYNRVMVGTNVTDTAAPYAYTSNVMRQANASAGNQVSFVSGLAEDIVNAVYNQTINPLAVNTANGTVAIGLDSTTTAITGAVSIGFPGSTVATQVSMAPSAVIAPQLGRHFIAALEQGDNVNANNFNSNTSTGTLKVFLRM